MKKVIICKFEDLIGEEEAISVKTMLKIEKLKKEKYTLIVNSKKRIEDILYYNRDFPFIDFIINDKGYYFYDVKKNKKVINNKLSMKYINKIYKLYPNTYINFVGENGLIKGDMIKDEDIYEINVFSDDIKVDDSSLNIKKNKDKIIITKNSDILNEIRKKLKIDTLKKITKGELEKFD